MSINIKYWAVLAAFLLAAYWVWTNYVRKYA